MKIALIRRLAILFLIAACAFVARAQGSSSSSDEPDFIVPSRPTVSNPAEFQRPGVLQLEFGYRDRKSTRLNSSH